MAEGSCSWWYPESPALSWRTSSISTCRSLWLQLGEGLGVGLVSIPLNETACPWYVLIQILEKHIPATYITPLWVLGIQLHIQQKPPGLSTCMNTRSWGRGYLVIEVWARRYTCWVFLCPGSLPTPVPRTAFPAVLTQCTYPCRIDRHSSYMHGSLGCDITSLEYTSSLHHGGQVVPHF